jgi:hypothetical protein
MNAQNDRLRQAYTLLCSAEPALIRGVNQAPNSTSLHYQQLLLDQVREWILTERIHRAREARNP